MSTASGSLNKYRTATADRISTKTKTKGEPAQCSRALRRGAQISTARGRVSAGVSRTGAMLAKTGMIMPLDVETARPSPRAHFSGDALCRSSQ
jgi:hypothetical protein